MREIKFRAWDKKNKYMFGAGYNDWAISKIETHDFLKLTLDGIVVRQMSYSDDPSDSLGDLETETDGEYILMQFTGLNDKNGKDVYEGDIVNCSCGCPHEIIFGGENGMPGWRLKGTSVGPMGDYEWTGDEEVIGNKFDTPELLK